MKHTPLPWRVGDMLATAREVRTDDALVAIVFDCVESNADLICRACNAHATLVAACKAVLRGHNTPSRIRRGRDCDCHLCVLCQAALALVEPPAAEPQT